MQREYKISLSQEFYSDVVYLSQYDSDYDVIFKVMNKLSAVDVDGKSAKFTGTRKDGLGFTFETIGTGSYVSFEINTSLTAVAGHHTAEIVFYDSQGLYFGSANVQVVVEPAARKDGTIDADTERAQEIAEEIQEIVDNAAATVKGEAEAWAVGQRDGEDVPSTDPTYENNAKYYAEQAQDIADSIGIDATLSISGKAADAKKTGDEISELKEDLNSEKSIIFLPSAFAPALTKGRYINTSTGINTSGSAWARTGLWNGYGSRVAINLSNSAYAYRIHYYDSTGNLNNGTGYLGYSGLTKTGVQYIPKTYNGQDVALIALSIKRVDGETITDADCTAIVTALSAYTYTDKTLNIESAPADAKTVGESMASLNDGLTASNGASVIGRTTPLSWTVEGAGYIDSDGAVHDSTVNSHTNYVRVDQYESISYKRQGITSSSPAAYMSFYGADKSLIVSIGAKPSQSANGYIDHLETYKVPNGAVYARFSCYTDTETYGTFEAYGISAVSILNQYALYPYGKTISALIKGSNINVNTGKTVANSKVSRTGSLLTAERCAIRLTGHTYKMQVLAYGTGASLSTGNGYIGKLTAMYIENDIVYIPPTVPVVALTFVRVDGEDMTDADTTAILSSLTCYVPYDLSLFRSITTAFTSLDDVALMPTASEVFSAYDTLVEQYPEYISKNALTVNGFTNYEYVLTIGNYNPQTAYRSPDTVIDKPIVLITSGVHGYERSSVMSLYAFVKAMCENDYALSDIIDIAEYHIIPIVCPWAYDNDSRVDENGVNINCNFDTSTWEETAQGGDYSGPSPASEAETQWMQSWVDSHTDATILIDWHNSSKVEEISCLLGLNGQTEKDIKKKYLLGINKVIPYWQRKRGLATDNIYAYTGNTVTRATLKNYCIEKGIVAFTMETSWNVKSTGKHSNITIGTGCEAMGNLLIGLKSYLEDVTDT